MKNFCAEKLNFGLLPKYIARLGSWPRRAGWPWAVHSVHSAYFWLGSTWYFPESKFLDIVREPGS